MRILTVENKSIDMAQVPTQVDDIHFGVLDNSDPKNVDYFFVPMIFLESFNSAAVVLKIDGCHVKMPIDWQILIGSPESGDLEIIPIMQVNDRGFHSFMFNPLSSFSPEFKTIEIVDIYQDVTWFSPRLKSGQILCVPLEEKEKPRCVYFVKEVTKYGSIVDYTKAW